MGPNGNIAAEIILTAVVAGSGVQPDVKLISFIVPYHTVSGIISSNTVWDGYYKVEGNITVNPGISLTIHPSTHIFFANGTSLIINGSLNSIGNSNQTITFTSQSGTTPGSWGSIVFDVIPGAPVGSSNLNYIVMKYGTDIKIKNGHNVIIQNSRIEKCTQGIYVYNSQPRILNNQIIEPVQNGIYCNASGKSPTILHNVITKTSGKNYQGIWLENNTTGYIAHNDISGFYWGMFIGGGSHAYFSDTYHTYYNPNNRIKESLYGFAAGWGSYILAGMGYWAYNSVYNNTNWDVKCYNNSTIYANHNYWGGGSPKYYVDGTSYLDISYPLTQDPWEQPSSPISSGGDFVLSNSSVNYAKASLTKLNYLEDAQLNPNNNSDNSDRFSDIFTGINLEKEGKVNEAVNHYKQMINKNSFADFALTEIVKLKNKYAISDNVQDYLENLFSKDDQHKIKIMNLLAGINLQNYKYEEAMTIYDEIIKLNPESYEGISAMFEKFFASINYNKDFGTASNLLSEISSINFTDEELLMRKEMAEYLLNNTINPNYFENPPENFVKENEESNEILPKEYELLGNYPNPFNPSTTISYALPQISDVEIVIYDIMGREVKRFVIPSQSGGYQKVVWDGRNNFGVSVSSGIYIYRFRANSLEDNNKSFEKTSKFMLLK